MGGKVSPNPQDSWTEEKLRREGRKGLSAFTSAWIGAGEALPPDVALPTIETEPTEDRETELRAILSKLAANIPGRGLMDEVAHAICKAYDCRISELKSPRRSQNLVRARQHAFWIMHKYLDHVSMPMIGRFFGNRDHTTVLWGIRQHEKRMAAQ